jgi:broad specificity phosphatase PhoE
VGVTAAWPAAATLVLVRHGVAEGAGERCADRLAATALTAEGREQAVAAAARIGGAFDLVVSSPARRARETAAAWGLPVTLDERLAERSFGEWEGRPWAELWPTVPAEVRTDPAAWAAFTPPGGEALAEVAARVRACVCELTATPGRRVLAVTHAGPLRLAVGFALGLPGERALGLGADHGGSAVLRRWDETWLLDRLNA